MIRANLRNLIIEYPDHDNLLKQNELNKIKELLLSFKKLDSDVRDGSIAQGSVANIRINSNKYLIIFPLKDTVCFAMYSSETHSFSRKLDVNDLNVMCNPWFITLIKDATSYFMEKETLQNLWGFDFETLLDDVKSENETDEYRKYTKEYNLDFIHDPDITDDFDIGDDR